MVSIYVYYLQEKKGCNSYFNEVKASTEERSSEENWENVGLKFLRRILNLNKSIIISGCVSPLNQLELDTYHMKVLPTHL